MSFFAARMIALTSVIVWAISLDASRAGVREEVIEQWTRKSLDVRTAKFVLKSNHHVKAGSHGPSQDTTYEEHRVLYLDVVGGRIRSEYRGQIWMSDRGQYRPQMKYEIFDGAQVGVVSPHSENRSAVYQPSAMQPELTLKSDYQQWMGMLASTGGLAPVFASVGFPAAFYKQRDMLSFKDLLRNTNHFTWEEQTNNNIREAVLRAKGSHEGSSEEWRVRPDWDGAIVSRRVFTDGALWWDLNVEFDASPRRMPKRWTTRSLRIGPNYAITYELERYKINPTLPDALFRIPIEGKDLVFKDGKYMLQTKDGQFLPTTPADVARLPEEKASGARPQ